MSYKNYLMYAACVFQALAVAGQDSTRWSLQECIDYAIAHNIQLKQNKITEEQTFTVHTAGKMKIGGTASTNIMKS